MRKGLIKDFATVCIVQAYCKNFNRKRIKEKKEFLILQNNTMRLLQYKQLEIQGAWRPSSI